MRARFSGTWHCIRDEDMLGHTPVGLTMVVLQSRPRERTLNAFYGAWHSASLQRLSVASGTAWVVLTCPVGVLYSQYPLSTGLARVEVVVKGRPQTTKM